jgi:hypothetical protein|tara:strand:- start:2067 stop:2333 length:267 start_codon:yes stop_codon:yes gene_type:complete
MFKFFKKNSKSVKEKVYALMSLSKTAILTSTIDDLETLDQAIEEDTREITSIIIKKELEIQSLMKDRNNLRIDQVINKNTIAKLKMNK